MEEQQNFEQQPEHYQQEPEQQYVAEPEVVEEEVQPEVVEEEVQPEVVVEEVMPEVVVEEVMPEVVEEEVMQSELEVQPEPEAENIVNIIDEMIISIMDPVIEMDNQYVLPREMMVIEQPIAPVEVQQPVNPTLMPLFGGRSARRNPGMRLYM
jgi:hypothetical protein